MRILWKGPRKVFLGFIQYMLLGKCHVTGTVKGTREKNYKVMSILFKSLMGQAFIIS